MTRDDAIKLAQEACDTDKSEPWDGGVWIFRQESIERFANLVAAAEREACREIAFRMAHSDEDAVDVSHAIRARGET